MADLEDPRFWGIVAALYLFCLAVTWKFMFGAWVTTKTKIIMSIVLGPIIYGITYMMTREG